MDVIASTALPYLPAQGEPQAFRIEIGRPFRVTEGEWACPVALPGLYSELSPLQGEDAVQALSLAMDLVRRLLESCWERKCRFQFADGSEEWPLEAYFPCSPSTPPA